MLSEKMQNELNEQLNYELFSAYVYFSMEAYFLDKNLNGFANWMHVQAMEEMTHVLKFFNFLHESDGRVLLKPVEGPRTEWGSSLEAFEEAYAHEQSVTRRIHNIVDLALREKDFATHSFLQWFVNEQVEEENNAKQNVQNVKMVSDNSGAIFLLDRELAARVFVPPAASAE